MSQAVYASPVAPAEKQGLLGLQMGLAITAVELDENASYYINSVSGDITSGGYVVVPRLVVSKGFGGWSLSASYGKAPDSDIKLLGASIDLPIIDGGYTAPTIAVRVVWTDLRGVTDFDLTTYGVEGFISKSFGPITPYGGVGISRTESNGRIPETALTDEIRLSTSFENERLTAGVRLSLALFEIDVEATDSADLSYSARVTFGF